jgi:hypothetical protein
MPGLFIMPELPKDQREISLYRTPIPEIDKKIIDKSCNAFSIKGKVEDLGSRVVVKDRSGVLEIFEASGSIWWTRNTRIKSIPLKSVSFPNEKEAIAKANTYLKTIDFNDKQANSVSVTYTETLYERNKHKEPLKVITQQHVNYEFRLEGLPVWGSGAKIQVTFGKNNQVIEVFKFWRKPKKERNRLKLIKAKKAAKIFQDHEAFSDLSERTAKVQVDEVTLGFYSLPPMEVQPCLIPVYRFKGFVSTEHLKRYDFTKYVIAVELTADLLKKTGAGVTEVPLVI